MDAVRKELPYDRDFIEPMRELRETVDAMPWSEMTVKQMGRAIKVMGKGKTLVYPDGWTVQYCMYDQQQYIKKVIQIRVKGHEWLDIPHDERHGRANVVLDTFFNKDNDIAETGAIPNGIQIAQDEIHHSMIIH